MRNEEQVDPDSLIGIVLLALSSAFCYWTQSLSFIGEQRVLIFFNIAFWNPEV